MSFSRRFWIICALIVAVALTFGESIAHDWVMWDDQVNVYQNPLLNPPTAESIAYFWRKPYYSLYMPLMYSFWGALACLARLPEPIITDSAGTYTLAPQVFHGAGVALHALNTVLVFLLLCRLVRSQSSAALGALLFGVHPVQVEPVVWVTGMNNVLSGTFALLALHQYLCFAQNEGKPRARLHYIIALLGCVFALLAKPTAVALPLMAMVLDCWVIKRPFKRSAAALLPWVGAVVVCVLMTRQAQDPNAIVPQSPLWMRPLLVLDSLAFYIEKTVLPVQLGIDYGRIQQVVMEQARQGRFLLWLLPLALGIVTWRKRATAPLLWVAWWLFMIPLLPTSGIVPFYFHAISLVADRYLYLALLGPALALAWALEKAPAKTAPTAKKVIGGGLVVLGVWSAFVTLNWSNSFSLFEQALRVNPRSWIAQGNYGNALERQGKVEEAITRYQAALALNSADWIARTSYGNALQRQGKIEQAIEQYETALRFRPTYAEAHYNLGIALLRQGDKRGAREHWQRAAQLKEEFSAPRKALETLEREEGKSP